MGYFYGFICLVKINLITLLDMSQMWIIVIISNVYVFF